MEQTKYSSAEIDVLRTSMPILTLRRDALSRAIETLEYLRDTEIIGEAAASAVEGIIAKHHLVAIGP